MASIFTDKYADFDLATGANDGSTAADAWRTPAAVIAGVAAGNRVNIKRQASAYNLTSSVTFNVAGTILAPIWYRAYTTTIGDGGMWECAYNAGGVANLKFTGNYNYVEGVSLYKGASSNLNDFSVEGVDSVAIRCKIVLQCNSGTIFVMNARRCWFEVNGSSSGTINVQGTNAQNVHFDQCVFYKKTSTAGNIVLVDTYGRAATFTNCIFIGTGNASEYGLQLDRPADGRGVTVDGCRFYNMNDGIRFNTESNAANEGNIVRKCLFDTMGGYAVKRVAGTDLGYVRITDCFYRSCTSGFSNYIDSADEAAFNIQSLSGNPFVDTSLPDLEMDTTSGEGQKVRDAETTFDPTGTYTMKTQPFGQWWKVPATGGGSTSYVIGS